MSTGSVDERVRAVLDLGDSSGVVKALDQELNKLLDDFKKQTELFDKGQISTKDYTDALNKMKSEVSGVNQAIKDLGGGGGGIDLEMVNRKLFALERGMTSLMSGTGLGRAGGLLESGLSIFGGPAGLGVMVALIANTIDQVAPKINKAWHDLFDQFSTEQVQAKMQELDAKRKGLADSVKQIMSRPVPGTESIQAETQKMLAATFNAGTMTGPKSWRQAALEAIIGAPGATPTDLTQEEKQIIDRELRPILDPATVSKELLETQGSTGWLIGLAERMGRWPERVWTGDAMMKKRATDQFRHILQAAAERTMGQLLVDAQAGGQTGEIALTALRDLATRHPDLFASDAAQQIDKILQLQKTQRMVGGGFSPRGQAAAAIRLPNDADLQREQMIEQMEQGRLGSRSAREGREREMFQRDMTREMLQQFPGLNLGNPQHVKLMQAQEAAAWQAEWGGPATRGGQERVERETAVRERMFEIMSQHPEMTFEEAQRQARAEVGRIEAAMYPERRGHRPAQRRQPAPRAGRPHPMGPMHQVTIPHRVEPPVISEQMREIMNRDPAEQLAEIRARTQAMTEEQDAVRAQIAAMREKQHQALKLEEAGLKTHAKTQQVVAGLQYQIERLYGLHRSVDNNAANLLRGQQRSEQNTTGSP